VERPYSFILVSASLDGRMALGPNRTQWEEMWNTSYRWLVGG
jgi:hypothetical protein